MDSWRAQIEQGSTWLPSPQSLRFEKERGCTTDQDATPNAAPTGTLPLGEDLVVNRLGFGAMRLTGNGVWGQPEYSEEARRVLRWSNSA
jgi:hypothetical protein